MGDNKRMGMAERIADGHLYTITKFECGNNDLQKQF